MRGNQNTKRTPEPKLFEKKQKLQKLNWIFTKEQRISCFYNNAENNNNKSNRNENCINNMTSPKMVSHASVTLVSTTATITASTKSMKAVFDRNPKKKYCSRNTYDSRSKKMYQSSKNQLSGAAKKEAGSQPWSKVATRRATTRKSSFWPSYSQHFPCLLTITIILITISTITATMDDDHEATIYHRSRISRYASTTPIIHKQNINQTKLQVANITNTSTASKLAPNTTATLAGNLVTEEWQPFAGDPLPNGIPLVQDSIFMRFAKRFSTGNELWDGIIQDCYLQPTPSCFQKNVYSYLNEALEARDVNVTQLLKFYKNQVAYETSTESTTAATDNEKRVQEMKSEKNEMPKTGRSEPAIATLELPPATPIEEVTNALYSKSIEFAITHDLELKLPELLFDGATFRMSPRSIEGNGVIAKLELIPKQEVKARLAGKFLMKKIQKFLKSKLLLSFLALLVIIKIIKIKLFWLLPIIIGVGAAKKLLLKFLLFLFPALSHLFKLCSYYQQSYHTTTKFHHHHHLINHHHTVVPPWHSEDHHSVPEIIYTNPPKGHPSAYLHGAPIQETHGAYPGHDHYEGAWENSGPGLGSEYISDINRVAHIDENPNYFKPNNAKDSNEILAWGLETTQYPPSLQHHQPQRPPPGHQALSKQQKIYQKSHVSSHNFNPFQNQDKQSTYQSPTTKLRNSATSQSAQNYVYVQPSQLLSPQTPLAPSGLSGLAAKIASQYDPARNEQQEQSQQLSPDLSAQLKEAIRIQAEQRIIAQQQKILENQPFVQDGQPLYPKNYDPFYSPILQKIDKIVEQLGITDGLCKERLVCSMYKDPARYSPHSNFVSAELSRDTSDLEPVSNANESVLRFYRFIQAARDGQDQKNCLTLYPQCNINTE